MFTTINYLFVLILQIQHSLQVFTINSKMMGISISVTHIPADKTNNVELL